MALPGRNDPAPLACSLPLGQLSARRERWRELIQRALIGKEATGGSARLRFRREGDVGRTLRELAELERECCSFATWTVVEQGCEVVLEVSAEGDAVGAVRALFEAAPGGSRA